MTVLLLLTKPPYHQLAWHGYRLTEQLLEQQQPFNLFFYMDAAQIANRLTWQPSDRPNLTLTWQKLAQQHQLNLPVCVSAALNRGITDPTNSQRHCLNGDNLAEGFSLVGLGELAQAMHTCDKLIQL